jgi:hypothetical protein
MVRRFAAETNASMRQCAPGIVPVTGFSGHAQFPLEKSRPLPKVTQPPLVDGADCAQGYSTIFGYHAKDMHLFFRFLE